MNRFLKALKAKVARRKLGLSHVNDADGIVSASLYLRKHLKAEVILAEPWEIKPKWTCWFNWFTWDFVADLPCPFKAKLYVDHHKTGRSYAELKVHEVEAPSSASLAIKALKVEDDEDAVKLVELANECDTASIKSSEAWNLNDAVKGSRIKDRVKLVEMLALKGVSALKDPVVRKCIKINEDRRDRARALVSKVAVKDFVFIELKELDEKFPVRNFMIMLEERGAKLACIIAHRGRKFKIYLGSRKDSGIDCAEIASKLGGGGHKFAAGATVEDLNEALEIIKKALGLKDVEVVKLP